MQVGGVFGPVGLTVVTLGSGSGPVCVGSGTGRGCRTKKKQWYDMTYLYEVYFFMYMHVRDFLLLPIHPSVWPLVPQASIEVQETRRQGPGRRKRRSMLCRVRWRGGW